MVGGSRRTPTTNEVSKIVFISIFAEIPSKLISAHTFAYISLNAMIPKEADETHTEYGFPVPRRHFLVLVKKKFGSRHNPIVQ